MIFKSREKKLFDEHRKLGFPKFSINDQLNMVVNADYQKIAKLTTCNEWTYELLDHYIFISIEDVAAYLSKSNKLESYIIQEETSQDGVWVIQKEYNYDIIDQERGVIHNRKNDINIDQVSSYIAKVMLSHIPKYENMNKW